MGFSSLEMINQNVVEREVSHGRSLVKAQKNGVDVLALLVNSQKKGAADCSAPLLDRYNSSAF